MITDPTTKWITSEHSRSYGQFIRAKHDAVMTGINTVLKDNPLFQLDNVLLTPHNAALTLECRKRMAVETCENIAYYLTNSDRLNKTNIINRKLLGLV